MSGPARALLRTTLIVAGATVVAFGALVLVVWLLA